MKKKAFALAFFDEMRYNKSNQNENGRYEKGNGDGDEG